ncbi:MAG: outer membrane beta-barrel protein [Bacteroidetes bacterium]|nr:outer membrane beta-barrel protein [Bacteroidota bacterium]
MKKLSFLILFVLFTLFIKNAKAQFEIGGNYGVSLSSIDMNNKDFGYGPSLEFRYYFTDIFVIGAHFADYSFQNSNYMMPLNLSLEYHSDLNGSFQSYYGVGFGIMKTKIYDVSSNDPIISAIFGTKYPINDHFAFNSNAHIAIIFQNNKQFAFDINIGLVYIIDK